MQRLQKKKHVLASMGSIAASGGFYVAMGGEKIYANPGTLTGSIGVISSSPTSRGC
jgi:protease-4